MVLLWCVLVDVWIVRCPFIAFQKEEKQLWLNAIKRKPTMIEFVDCISFQVLTVLIASINSYQSRVAVAGT